MNTIVAQSGTIMYHGKTLLSCEPCARAIGKRWYWGFFQGECDGCGCMLDPLWDSRRVDPNCSSDDANWKR